MVAKVEINWKSKSVSSVLKNGTYTNVDFVEIFGRSIDVKLLTVSETNTSIDYQTSRTTQFGHRVTFNEKLDEGFFIGDYCNLRGSNLSVKRVGLTKQGEVEEITITNEPSQVTKLG